MALTTFGAIMGFAVEMIGRSMDIYRTAVGKVKDPVLKENVQVLLEEGKKNSSLMEQTRRENVTEMILEPIAGLQQEDYEIDLKISGASEDSDLLKAALALEEKERRFFHDSSEKVPLPEVSRIFRKIARKKEKYIDHLKSLRLNM
ncbi:MAG: hypothetical protein KGZ49_12270 [Syntrophaceae bacterium]|nr:hypothetical protein [Syntrophaceae bacterium]